MNFEHLNIFIAVVENGGFTRAAEAMFISHSTTSRAVTALEDSLGVRLLDRNSRGFKLTAAGRLLYEQGGELLRRAEALEKQVSGAPDVPAGGLRIAIVPMSCPAMDSALERYCAENPEHEPEIYRRGLSEVKSMVASGKADLGVGFSYALGDMSGFEQAVLTRSKFCALVKKGHILRNRQPLTVEDLRGESYITAGERRSAFTGSLEAPILEERSPDEIHTATTLEALFMMVSSGKGLTLAPEPMAAQLGEGCELLELSFDSGFDVVLFWTEDGASVVSKFVETALSGSDGQGASS